MCQLWLFCIVLIACIGVVHRDLRRNQEILGRSGDTKHCSAERESVVSQIFQRSSEFSS